MKRYLEAGKIINTHGVRGELKIQPWADSAEFLKGFSVFYIDGKPFSVTSSHVHKGCLLAAFTGINNIDDANLLRNKIIMIDRQDAPLAPGAYFLQDVIGLTAIDADSGAELGKVTEILDLPGGNVFVISGIREILVPQVDQFIKKVDVENGRVDVHLIEGM